MRRGRKNWAGGTEDVGEECHLRERKGRRASSYAEGSRGGGGGFGIGGCGGGCGYDRVERGGRGIARAGAGKVGHCCV